MIVFAGVHFMAETAKILNPDKQVLLPDLNAGCSLAEGCPVDAFRAMRRQHPDHVSITYINCSADVKAESDIICTSSNAEKIIRQIPPEKPILFAPDRNLGRFLSKKTGRDMLLWDGSCVVHETFSITKILSLKMEYPDAEIIAHPECEDPVLSRAAFIGSTSALLRYVADSAGTRFIVATEPGIIHQMKKTAPGKEFIPAPPEANCSCNDCPYMKLNTLEKLYLCMRDRSPRRDRYDRAGTGARTNPTDACHELIRLHPLVFTRLWLPQLLMSQPLRILCVLSAFFLRVVEGRIV